MFDRSRFWEIMADKMFEYNHPIASALATPIAILILFLSLIWSVSAVGKHGIIPGVALVICMVVMHILYGKVSHGVIFVWIQPFICYAELIFIKYVFKANDSDPGVGVIGWLVFAAITLVLFGYSAYFLDIVDSAWGFFYIIAYAMAWIFTLIHQHYVYYIVVYLFIYAAFITVYSYLRKQKNKDFELADGSVFAGAVLIIITFIACAHPAFYESHLIPKTPIELIVSVLEMSEI